MNRRVEVLGRIPWVVEARWLSSSDLGVAAQKAEQDAVRELRKRFPAAEIERVRLNDHLSDDPHGHVTAYRTES